MKSFDPRPDTRSASQPADEPAAAAAIELIEPPKSASARNGRHHKFVAPVRVALELELSPAVCPPGYAPRGIDLLLDTTAQRVTLKLLTASLIAGQATLIDGTPIKRSQQAIAWLLEQVAVRLPQPLLDELLDGAA